MFASANELWRASLDTLDFMPLSSVNYSGGIIITDWYSDGDNLNESVKISIRFLTNEVRADALDIKVFYKKCNQVASCKISQKRDHCLLNLKKQILSKATIYKKQKKDKNFKPYKGGTTTINKIIKKIFDIPMERYNFKTVEEKWQKSGLKSKSFSI